jgi:hypothetical protein
MNSIEWTGGEIWRATGGTLVALDLGVHAVGLAIFRDGVLVHADTVTATRPRPPARAQREAEAIQLAWIVAATVGPGKQHALALEIPVERTGGKRRARTADLISLGIVGGACLAALRPLRVVPVSPAGWKGTVPKETHQPLIWAALTPAEAATVRGDHNAVDAVGVGLWALGRLKGGRSRPPGKGQGI